MSQLTITSFLNKAPKNGPIKRKYQDIVDELVGEAEKAFDGKKMKILKKSEKDSLNAPQKSYRKYTVAQKKVTLQLLSHFSYAEIERKYGVDESTQKLWVRTGVKEDGRKSNGRVIKTAETDAILIARLSKMLEEAKPITSKVILNEAKKCYIERYNITSKDFELLQQYARFCAKQNLNSSTILYAPSDEIFQSFDSKDQVTTLRSEEIVQLRDAFLKIKHNLVIMDHNWLHRFTTRNKFSYRRITQVSI